MQKATLVALVILGVRSLSGPSAFAQENGMLGFSQHRQEDGTLTCREPAKIVIHVHSLEQRDQFLIRKRIHELIEATWRDDASGIYDVKKVREIKTLAKKLN